MAKSFFLRTVLVTFSLISYSTAQPMDDDATGDNCTTAVCSAICAKAPFGSGTICKTGCPTVGSTAIAAGCKNDDPCTGICSKMPSTMSGFCKTACTKAGSAAIKTACQKCATPDSSFLFEDDQPTL